MTVIRPATEADIPRIVEMGSRFYALSGLASIADMVPEQMAGIALITMKSDTMLVAEQEGVLVGMICLHLTPFIFNVAATISEELAFWIEPEHRGGMLAVRLIKAGERAAKARGATWNKMAYLNSSPVFLREIYTHLGYTPIENYVIKAL